MAMGGGKRMFRVLAEPKGLISIYGYGRGERGCSGCLHNLKGWSLFMAMGGGRGCLGCLQNLRG